jgi:hypothetical protein
VRKAPLVSLAIVFAAVTAGCARDPVRPYPGEPTPGFRPSVDDSPEWSHDGRLIAFHRRFYSSYGPPGAYVIEASGGTPRFLVAGDFAYPTSFRFSPDSRYIACEGGFQLLIVDLLTGDVAQPMYTANGVSHPDWDPTGRLIAYRRLMSFPDDPPDSIGLHIFDTAAGTDRPIPFMGSIRLGDYPLWSKDGRDIAAIEYVNGDHFRLSLLGTDGSNLRVLVETQPGDYLNLLRKYVYTGRGQDGLAMSTGTIGVGGRYVFMNWDGTGQAPLPTSYNPTDAYSPDGSWGVGVRFDPSDSNYVLFVFRSDDITGTSYRQLTRYMPPAESTPAPLAAIPNRFPMERRRPSHAFRDPSGYLRGSSLDVSANGVWSRTDLVHRRARPRGSGASNMHSARRRDHSD